MSPRLARWLTIVSAAVTVVFVGFLLGSCLSSRAAARAFVDALHDQRFDEARGMLSPELRQRVPPEIWAARDVRWGGIAQSGFQGILIPYGCFEGEIEGPRTFWIVVRRQNAAWQITDLRLTEPEPCEGE